MLGILAKYKIPPFKSSMACYANGQHEFPQAADSMTASI